MKMLKMMTLIGGMGTIGFMYMKKNPNVVNKMKSMIKDASRNIYNKLEEE